MGRLGWTPGIPGNSEPLSSALGPWSCLHATPRGAHCPGEWRFHAGGGDAHHFCSRISRSPLGVGFSFSTYTLRGALWASSREMSLAAMAKEYQVPATWGGTLSYTPGTGRGPQAPQPHSGPSVPPQPEPP